MNGIMLGLTPREARKRYESVIEFAELEEFKDLKLKNYSSGMHVRLAFSVAIQVDADILMIDEVLAVGDAAFQQKCFDVFNDLRDRGRTIVFVTHDMGALQRFCHRALLLERGRPVHMGEPHEVADRYLELNFGREVRRPRTPPTTGTRATDRRACWRCGSRVRDGAHLSSVPQHERVTLKARVAFTVEVDRSGGEGRGLQRRAPRGARRHDGDRERAQRPFPQPARRWSCPSRSTTCWLPGATHRCSRSRIAARAWT